MSCQLKLTSTFSSDESMSTFSSTTVTARKLTTFHIHHTECSRKLNIHWLRAVSNAQIKDGSLLHRTNLFKLRAVLETNRYISYRLHIIYMYRKVDLIVLVQMKGIEPLKSIKRSHIQLHLSRRRAAAEYITPSGTKCDIHRLLEALRRSSRTWLVCHGQRRAWIETCPQSSKPESLRA